MSIKKAVLFLILFVFAFGIIAGCNKVNNFENYFNIGKKISELSCYSFDTTVVLKLSLDDVSSVASGFDIQAEGIESSQVAQSEDIKVFISITGQMDKTNKLMSCDISFKTDETDSYKKILPLVADEKYLYIGIKPLINAIFEEVSLGMTQREFENQISAYTGSKDFVSIPIDELKVWEKESAPNAYTALAERVADKVRELLVSMENAFAYDKSKNEYSLTLNDVDIRNIVGCILDDMESNANWYYDTLLNAVSEQKNENKEEVLKKLREKRETNIEALKASVLNAKEAMSDIGNVTLVSSLAYNKKENTYKTEFKLSYKDSDVVAVTQTIKPQKEISVTAPSDYYDLSELIKSLFESTVSSFASDPEYYQDDEYYYEDSQFFESDFGDDDEFIFEEVFEDSEPDTDSSPALSELDSDYNFIGIKKIKVDDKDFEAVYFKDDHWYYISNDGLYSSKGNISISTRVTPYFNKTEGMKDQVYNLLLADQKYMLNNTEYIHEIISTSVQGTNNSSYGVLKYAVSDGINEYPGCFNVYKKELSQDGENVIETILIYTPNFWESNDGETLLLEEILDYMKIKI